MKFPKCGEENRKEAIFLQKCGAKIKEEKVLLAINPEINYILASFRFEYPLRKK